MPRCGDLAAGHVLDLDESGTPILDLAAAAW
jgi:hypothetical protein